MVHLNLQRKLPHGSPKNRWAVAQGSAQEWQNAADSGGVAWQVSCAEAGKAEGRAADAAGVIESALAPDEDVDHI